MAKHLPTNSSQSVDRFLAAVEKHPIQALAPSRLIFALDATASREPTWDLASSLHAEMFNAVDSAKLAIQLVSFGGFNQFRSSSWNSSPAQLLQEMQRVRCLGGITQIGRVLDHLLKEASTNDQLKAAVYIGDMCEEPLVELLSMAGQLGLRRVPVFMFQEGRERYATEVFRSIAERSGGVHMPFESGSAKQLAEMLKTVAVYATEGYDGIKLIDTPLSRKLLTQAPKK